MTLTTRPDAPHSLRKAEAVTELFVSFFRRDLLNFYPQSRLETAAPGPGPANLKAGPGFRLIEDEKDRHGPLQIELFGVRYTLVPRGESRFTPHDRRMIRAIGAVLNLRYHHLFQVGQPRGSNCSGGARKTITSPPSSSPRSTPCPPASPAGSPRRS